MLTTVTPTHVGLLTTATRMALVADIWHSTMMATTNSDTNSQQPEKSVFVKTFKNICYVCSRLQPTPNLSNTLLAMKTKIDMPMRESDKSNKQMSDQ